MIAGVAMRRDVDRRMTKGTEGARMRQELQESRIEARSEERAEKRAIRAEKRAERREIIRENIQIKKEELAERLEERRQIRAEKRAAREEERAEKRNNRMVSMNLPPELADEDVPNDDFENLDTVPVNYGGTVYSIPVGSDGYVPMFAMAQRLQMFREFEDDVESNHDIVLQLPLTPEEIVEWWADPSCCDIEGLDTPDSSVYDVSHLPREQRMVQSKIAVIAPPEEAQRIRREIAKAFTIEELEKMARGESVVVQSVGHFDKGLGCYYYKQDGMEVPLIVLEDDCPEDSIVHEMTHHLRRKDTDRPEELRSRFPMRPDGALDTDAYYSMTEDERDRIVEEEEKMTVAETVARTRTDDMQSGYYDRGGTGSPRQKYVQDRRLMTDTPTYIPEEAIPRLKGKAAKEAVLKGYAYSNIADSEILSYDVKKD